MVKIHCGIEIEAEYNADILSVQNLGYHSHTDDTLYHNFGEAFKTEGDASLRTSKFRNGGTSEFISIKFNIDDYKLILDNFYQTIITKSKNSKLDEVLHFNNSTGCHIHISMSSDKGIKLPFKMLDKGKLIKFNTRLLTRVKTELPDVYPEFSKGFYRDYAKQYITDVERRCTWNFTLNDVSRLEFRSFNLRGVKNWEQFRAIFDIVFDELKKLVTGIVNTGFSFKSSFGKKEIVSLVKLKTNELKLEPRKVLVVEV